MDRWQLKMNAIADVCLTAASLSTCVRKKQGAVIFSEDFTEIYWGYNGAPAGVSHCKGEDDNKHGCGCVHAEMNACLKAKLDSYTVYRLMCTQLPCLRCAQAIIQKGIHTVYYLEDHQNKHGLTLLKNLNSLVLPWKIETP